VDVFDPGPLPHPNAASTDITKMIRMDYGADESTRSSGGVLPGLGPLEPDWDRLYHETGFLLSSEDCFSGRLRHDSYVLLRRRGHAVEHFETASLRRRFPAWAADRYRAYYNRGGWAESGRVVARSWKSENAPRNP
jgi:hypothetical protein